MKAVASFLKNIEAKIYFTIGKDDHRRTELDFKSKVMITFVYSGC